MPAAKYKGLADMCERNPHHIEALFVALCRRHSYTGIHHSMPVHHHTMYLQLSPGNHVKTVAYGRMETNGGVCYLDEASLALKHMLKGRGWTMKADQLFPPQRHCDQCPYVLSCATKRL